MTTPTFGAYIRNLREARGLSVEEVTQHARLPEGYLSLLEGDDTYLPTAMMARDIRATLGAESRPFWATYRTASIREEIYLHQIHVREHQGAIARLEAELERLT